MVSAAEEHAEIGSRAYAVLRTNGPSAVRLLLHPYLHWTRPDGSLTRGRANVLSLLDQEIPSAAPRVTELRDGQIYRWDSSPG